MIKPRMRTALVATSMLVVAFAAHAQDAPPELDHRIPPGYQPQEGKDEVGLWHEMEELEAQVNKSALLVRDPALNRYVGDIVCRVAGPYCDDFRVYVIRNPGFNASMTANGMMQIWTGLIVRASSTDEIAAVIAHEIAHFTRLHSLEGFRALRDKMSRSAFFDIALTALTGVGGLAQMGAAMSYLAFNREQETEADLLGARLLADSGYDVHASYRVWENVIAEEQSAVVKREEPGVFSKTHPGSAERMVYLSRWVEERYGSAESDPVTDQPFLDVMNAHYLYLMEDQLDTNRFGRTSEILERHSEIGIKPALVHYFHGEMFRQRNESDDVEYAMRAYVAAIESGDTPPEAYKNLAYLHLKRGEVAAARENFRQYLAANPAATDRAMIEYYLEDESQ